MRAMRMRLPPLLKASRRLCPVQSKVRTVDLLKLFLLVTLTALICIAFVTAGANSPFSLLFGLTHSRGEISQLAEDLNESRTRTAKHYFISFGQSSETAVRKQSFEEHDKTQSSNSISTRPGKVSVSLHSSNRRLAAKRDNLRTTFLTNIGNLDVLQKSRTSVTTDQSSTPATTKSRTPATNRRVNEKNRPSQGRNYRQRTTRRTLPPTTATTRTDSEGVTVAIGIVTVKRKAPHAHNTAYLLQTTAALHSILSHHKLDGNGQSNSADERRYFQNNKDSVSEEKNVYKTDIDKGNDLKDSHRPMTKTKVDTKSDGGPYYNGVDEDIFANSVLFVCNVDDRPHQHTDAIFLKKYVTVIDRLATKQTNEKDTVKHNQSGNKVDTVLHQASRSGSLNSSSTFWQSVQNETAERFVHRKLEYNRMYDKERRDYMFCLQAALGFKPRYVLLMEDDAVALPDMPDVVNNLLHRLTTKPDFEPSKGRTEKPAANSDSKVTVDLVGQARGRRNDTYKANRNKTASEGVESENSNQFLTEKAVSNSFVYLKLFYPLRWQGFQLEPSSVGDLVCVSAVLTSIAAIAMYMCRHSSCGTVLSGTKLLCVLVVSVVVCLTVGRQNLNELRRVSEHTYRLQTAPDCCTQAILYPADVIPSLITWLDHCPTGSHVDLCLAEYVKQSAVCAYYVEPNLFSHVGTVTSLGVGHKGSEEVLFHRSHTQLDTLQA